MCGSACGCVDVTRRNQTFSALSRWGEVCRIPRYCFPCSPVPVVLLNAGPSAGKIAVIAEIIDHNRVTSPLLHLHPAHPLPGSSRRPNHLRPPPVLPLPPSLPHTPPPHQAPPRRRVGRHPQTARKGRHRRQVGKLGMGKEACRHPKTTGVERLCALRGHVGEKGEKRRRAQGPGKGMIGCRTRITKHYVMHEYDHLPFRACLRLSLSPPDMPVVQFAPFASIVQPAFWHELTRLKIDVLRLSQDSLTLTGAYSVGRSVRDRETGQDVALGCNLSLGADAFDEASTYVLIATDRSSSPSIQRPHLLCLGPWRLSQLQHDTRLQGCRQGRPLQRPRRRGVPGTFPITRRDSCTLDLDQHRRAQGPLETQPIPSHHLCRSKEIPILLLVRLPCVRRQACLGDRRQRVAACKGAAQCNSGNISAPAPAHLTAPPAHTHLQCTPCRHETVFHRQTRR